MWKKGQHLYQYRSAPICKVSKGLSVPYTTILIRHGFTFRSLIKVKILKLIQILAVSGSTVDTSAFNARCMPRDQKLFVCRTPCARHAQIWSTNFDLISADLSGCLPENIVCEWMMPETNLHKLVVNCKNGTTFANESARVFATCQSNSHKHVLLLTSLWPKIPDNRQYWY